MLVCSYCFSDESLRQKIDEKCEIQSNGQCEEHPNREGIEISQIARVIFEFIGENYVDTRNTRNTALLKAREKYGETLHDILEDLTDGSMYISTELEELLTGPPYHLEEPYDETMPRSRHYIHFVEKYSGRWEELKRQAIFHGRFFNNEMKEILDDIFRNIHRFRSDPHGDVVYRLDPSNADPIFRARVINDKSKRRAVRKNPASHLGAPPEHLRKPQRMSAAGILAFYGSFDIDTCIAEIGPPVGSWIVFAKFRLRRPIIVFDTTKLSQAIEDVTEATGDADSQLRRRIFMKRFMSEISQPWLPGDDKIEYVPTQVVAEYLTRQYRFEKEGHSDSTIDAIIYGSSQRPSGKNIVLYGDAGMILVWWRVERIDSGNVLVTAKRGCGAALGGRGVARRCSRARCRASE